MYSKYSDTIAREQQIRELTHDTKVISMKVQSKEHKSQLNQIILIALIHIILALFVFGCITINNGLLIREIYYALIITTNETYIETPSFFQTIR